MVKVRLLDDAIESANEAARDWITLELSEDDPFNPLRIRY